MAIVAKWVNPVFRKVVQSKFFEPAIIFGIAILLYFWGASVEAFELLVEFVEDHEDWDLDELILAAALLGLAGYIYAFRRQLEKQKEFKKRLDAESNLDWLSKHDHLTDLPNRHFLSEFVERTAAHQKDGKTKHFGLIAVDLDGFKKTNDLLGHAAGDAVLQEVARRIKSVAAAKLTFRLGGDEFLVITDLKDAASTLEVAQDIQCAILEPYSIGSAVSRIGVSMGISLLPDDTNDLNEAIQFADFAMYEAKRRGGNDIVMFERTMAEEMLARSELEQDFLQALAEKQIRAHYQPLVDLTENKIRGFEVLARWSHVKHGNVPPLVFVKLAEEIGVISDLSDIVFRQACLDALTWPEHMILSFNLSPLQLADKMVGRRLLEILAETGFPAHRLEVEITEGALVNDIEAATIVLEELRAADVQIAIDDFGTGYSNLSQLSKLHFDRVKIDRSFINDFAHDDKQVKIVKTILALSEGLGIKATAEGIEDREQLALLTELGCECGQGYYLGKPIDADATNDLIKSLEKGSSNVLAALRQHSA